MEPRNKVNAERQIMRGLHKFSVKLKFLDHTGFNKIKIPPPHTDDTESVNKERSLLERYDMRWVGYSTSAR